MSEEQFYATAKRRRLNPVREARRQAELTRMLRRMDYVPTYRDVHDGRGNIVSSTYTGHVAVRAR
jgi:hypothetical protein